MCGLIMIVLAVDEVRITISLTIENTSFRCRYSLYQINSENLEAFIVKGLKSPYILRLRSKGL